MPLTEHNLAASTSSLRTSISAQSMVLSPACGIGNLEDALLIVSRSICYNFYGYIFEEIKLLKEFFQMINSSIKWNVLRLVKLRKQCRTAVGPVGVVHRIR
jgi:hypothetical protein